MPVATSPFVLNDVSLTLILESDTTGLPEEYICQCNRAELVPSAQSSGSEFETFCDTFAAPPKAASWTLEITGFQAWSDAMDLSLLLFDNELKNADFVLSPILTPAPAPSTGNFAFEGQVILSPGQIGGTANQYAQMTVSLVVKGKPTKVLIPPAP